ncbi:hypothetical protein H8A95_04315 [Bradyrhizobium sp. Pear76]|uniref:hypothetical protein n=1 Tax=Bradyrhizobium oropedii TaxID=1571201 RepID=UPI001E64EE61|nr:hypothetical protein [Bradyrhizobium oropedii]MCC8961564.1 hypothetical protein [Bradyrhizobium oropedii]
MISILTNRGTTRLATKSFQSLNFDFALASVIAVTPRTLRCGIFTNSLTGAVLRLTLSTRLAASRVAGAWWLKPVFDEDVCANAVAPITPQTPRLMQTDLISMDRYPS